MAPDRVIVRWRAVKAPDTGPLPAPGPASTPHEEPKPAEAAGPSITADLPPMARVLAGGFELTPKQIAALRRSPGPEAKKIVGRVPGAGGGGGDYEIATDVIAVFELSSVHTQGGSVEILRGPRGEFLGRRDGDPKVRVLKPDVFGPLGEAGDWGAYAGPWDKAPAPFAPGVVGDVPPGMLRPATIRVDSGAIESRGLRPARFLVKAAATTLGDAGVHLRPPKGYSPRTPCGLLVWIDPGPGGVPPPPLDQACDQLNLAVVGVGKSGNDCETGDRTQRALDALATAEAILHIDRSRVYATGLSGGGRMTSIVCAGFPDLFAGGVSMAGVAHFNDHPSHEGNKIWPAYFVCPSGKRWEQYASHRLAATTGPKDFNHAQTLALMELQQQAGLDIKVWTYEDLGHEMPTAPAYAEVLSWVDEPQRQAALGRATEGAKLLAEAEKLTGDAQRKAMLKVMEKAPWSDPAWKAAAAVGFKP